jgi:hypothetical protein
MLKSIAYRNGARIWLATDGIDIDMVAGISGLPGLVMPSATPTNPASPLAAHSSNTPRPGHAALMPQYQKVRNLVAR